MVVEVTDAVELTEGVEDAEGVSERLTDVVAVWVTEEVEEAEEV